MNDTDYQLHPEGRILKWSNNKLDAIRKVMLATELFWKKEPSDLQCMCDIHVRRFQSFRSRHVPFVKSWGYLQRRDLESDSSHESVFVGYDYPRIISKDVSMLPTSLWVRKACNIIGKEHSNITL